MTPTTFTQSINLLLLFFSVPPRTHILCLESVICRSRMLVRDAGPGRWPVYWPMFYEALQDLSRWLYWRREVKVRDESVHIWYFMFPVDQDLFKRTPSFPLDGSGLCPVTLAAAQITRSHMLQCVSSFQSTSGRSSQGFWASVASMTAQGCSGKARGQGAENRRVQEGLM